MIKRITPRLYQQTIFATATTGNTLVVLPTGLGKTAIFIMLALHRLDVYPGSKVVFLGPTRPLIEQYRKVFLQYTNLEEQDLAVFTGFVKPEKRAALWQQAHVIFSTPQGLENDVLAGRISLKDVSLLGIDECHRAVGDYAYVFLAKEYHKQSGKERILGLTASPGADKETIKEVCTNLFIEHIEYRAQDDADVAPFIQDTIVEQVRVSLPPAFKRIQTALQQSFKRKMEDAKQRAGLKVGMQAGKAELLGLQRELHALVSRGEQDFQVYKAISLISEAIKLQHALELLETQTLETLMAFLQKLQSEAQAGKSKSVKNLVADIDFVTAYGLVHKLLEEKVEHPKVDRLVAIVESLLHQKPTAKLIIFTQYRDTGSVLVERLARQRIKASLFVGQAKRKETGLSQKEQKEMIESFANNDFPVLVSSSVGEEGLDIPVVDAVVFYEPIPSAIRKIQRSGRTGRSEKGNVIVLIAQGTRDEAFHWASHHKEKRMYRALQEVKKELHLQDKPKEEPKSTLLLYTKPEPELHILCDHREKGSAPMKLLRDQGVKIELTTLPVGDYIVGEHVVVEYKTVSDFVDSLVDGRIFPQLKKLKTYQSPVLLIEGEQDLYSVRRVHPNAVRGLLASIVVDFNIPLLWSRNAQDTAGLLMALARRDTSQGGSFQPKSGKPLTQAELQEFIVASLPGVGSALSKPLLRHFRTVSNIMAASVDDLQKVELIGKKKATAIRELLDALYKET